jgi:hypothetical protein
MAATSATRHLSGGCVTFNTAGFTDGIVTRDHDEKGCATIVTVHRLRHTFGTRLINSGVPQHVIQRLLGHASPTMTAVYAHLHDSTIRTEFERYCQTRVDVQGRLLGFDPQAVTADAEWVKHRLARAADVLPDGYCGRPPQQDCPIPTPV